VKNALVAAGILLLILPIPSIGGTADGIPPTGSVAAVVHLEGTKAGKSPGPATTPPAAPPAPGTPGVPVAAIPAAPVPWAVPRPASSVPPPFIPSPPAPFPGSVPSRLPAVPMASFVAPPRKRLPTSSFPPARSTFR